MVGYRCDFLFQRVLCDRLLNNRLIYTRRRRGLTSSWLNGWDRFRQDYGSLYIGLCGGGFFNRWFLGTLFFCDWLLNDQQLSGGNDRGVLHGTQVLGCRASGTNLVVINIDNGISGSGFFHLCWYADIGFIPSTSTEAGFVTASSPATGFSATTSSFALSSLAGGSSKFTSDKGVS